MEDFAKKILEQKLPNSSDICKNFNFKETCQLYKKQVEDLMLLEEVFKEVKTKSRRTKAEAAFIKYCIETKNQRNKKIYNSFKNGNLNWLKIIVARELVDTKLSFNMLEEMFKEKEQSKKEKLLAKKRENLLNRN